MLIDSALKENLPNPRPIITIKKISRKTSYLDGFPVDFINFSDGQVVGRIEPYTESKYGFYEMVARAKKSHAYGVAANQIGINKKIFVMAEFLSDKEISSVFRCYVHPKWTATTSSMKYEQSEGCLSIPNLQLVVPREFEINAEWLELSVQNEIIYRTEIMSGLKARIFQHECDHLEGKDILEISSLSRSQKRTVMKQL